MSTKATARIMIPSWASWIQVILACFVGALSGGYVAAQLALSKTDESLKSELAARSIDRFVGTGGEILRDGDKVTPLGTPVLKGLGLYTIESANEVRKALLYGGTLPGITELYFAPFDQIDKRVGGGVADENIMRFANRNFKGQIQFLDINHCRIQNVAILSPMTNLRKLKIVNNPLSLNGVRALNTLNTVNEIWIGWPDRTLEGSSQYRSNDFRRELVTALTQMESLKTAHLYNLQLTATEKEMLGNANIQWKNGVDY